jgi:hypothetical protein
MKLRMMRWAENAACMGEVRNEYNILVRTPEGKRPFRRPRCRWEGNIKMDLKEKGCGLDASGSSGDGPFAGPCENSNEPWDSIKRQEMS